MNTAFKRTLLSTLVVPFALGAASANAAMISDWGYETSNVFEDAEFEGGGDGGQTLEGSQELSWGEEGGSTDVPNGTRSSVAINDVNESSGLETNEGYVSGGTFTHKNNIIDADYASLSGFTITSTLNLTANDGSGFTKSIGPTSFLASFSETFNREDSDNCAGDSFGSFPCDDIFTLDNLPEGVTNGDGFYELAADQFVVDDYRYTVFLELQDLRPLGEETCGAAGAPSDCIGLLTEETEQNDFATRFRITATEVPEPGTLALLGLGLAGFGLSRRKKAAKA